MKKSRKLSCHVVNSNIAIGSLPTLKMSVVIFPLFEMIYNGQPIPTVVSNIGEDVVYSCYKELSPRLDALFLQSSTVSPG
jgi:hypothetical protein